jgi:hypothetical protein
LLTYSFGVIKWSKTNLQNINIKTRVLFTKFSKHHPKSAIERFILPGENGGRGFSNTYRRILVTPVRTNPDDLFDVYLSNLTNTYKVD